MSQSTRRVDGRRLEPTGTSEVVDALTTEAPLQIDLNGESFSVTMRTPGQDPALVRGLLFTEGIVSADATGWEYRPRPREGAPNSGTAEALDDVTIIDVTIPEIFICRTFYDRRSLVSSSSCGLCGIKEWGEPDPDVAPIVSEVIVSRAELLRAMESMRDRQRAFDLSGGCHGAAVFASNGECLAAAEDIGRHNAVDKAIGFLLENRSLTQAALLTVSGRISFEIVSKCYRAGVPILAAVSAPSTLAVEMGRRLGITVVGFCRDDRATAYSHPGRVTA